MADPKPDPAQFALIRQHGPAAWAGRCPLVPGRGGRHTAPPSALQILLAGAREADARPLQPCGVNEALNRPAARSRNPPFSIPAGSGSYSPILCPLLPGRTRVNVLTARFRPRGEPPAPGEAGLGSYSGEGVACGRHFRGPAARSAANLTRSVAQAQSSPASVIAASFLPDTHITRRR